MRKIRAANGDVRIRRVFLIFPKTHYSGTVADRRFYVYADQPPTQRWLEWATIGEMFVEYTSGLSRWETRGWIDD